MRGVRATAWITAALVGLALLTGAGGGGCAPEPSGGTAQKAPGGTAGAHPTIHVKIIFTWGRGTKRRLVLPIDVTFDAPRGQGSSPAFDPLHDGSRTFSADLRPGERATLDAHQAEPGPMACLGQIVDDVGHVVASPSHDSVPDGGGGFITCTVTNDAEPA